ncbi:MAG TPA: FAD-dependent monooxygenase [Pseudonocardiaceae bacterium]
MTNYIGDRAVVLGGSMAGLITARVLSDAYAQVTVVDRDVLSGVDTPRRGVPQGPHAHGLLVRGHQILEELFPGLTDDLQAADTPIGDLNGDIRWIFGGQRVAHGNYGLPCLSVFRPKLEAYVRSRVQKIPNITVIEQTDIVGIVASEDRTRIVGARVQSQEQGSTERVLHADLVVDATGRGSRTPVWLEELGYQRPEEEKIKIGLAYTTQQFKLPFDVFQGDLSINPVGGPDMPRGAIFSRLSESDPLHASLTLTGMVGDHPPADREGFLAFAKTLPAKEIYEAVKDAEPLTEAVTFRFPASQRRRYDKLSSMPGNFVVLGDAACSYNPLYGQGMGVAAIEGTTLREHLRRGPLEPLKFQRDIAKVIAAAWEVGANGDLQFPQVEGKRTLKAKLGNAYNAKVIMAGMLDAEITNKFFRVACFIDPPTVLLRPATMLKVFRLSRKLQKLAAAAAAAPPAQAPQQDPGDTLKRAA